MNLFQNAWVVFLILLSQPNHAVKMDESTHDMVIRRLEMGIESMDKSDRELPGIQIRLADLYADRARLISINEVDRNCGECKASREDRKRAIDLYKAALPKIDKDRQGRIVLQVAHLYGLNDESKKARKLYSDIVSDRKSPYPSEVKGLALASLGEIEFKSGNFPNARKYYESARKEKITNRGLIEYRLAWCQLNLGQFDAAVGSLARLLKDPSLLASQTSDGKAVDPTFVQDVSADLARFLARVDVGPKQIELLKSLSPEPVRKENLKVLAMETDRLGKKQAAVIAWAAYMNEGQSNPEEKIEMQARLAQTQYDMSRLAAAARAYEQAIESWKSLGCHNPSLCDEIKGRLRKFVTSWHKSQGTAPTADLFRAYAAYTRLFPDTDMLHWAGQVGAETKKYREAALMFHQASLQARTELGKNPNDNEMKKIFEGSLLGEIEMAEAANDAAAREAAYNHYLAINPQGAQAFQVRYQRATLFNHGQRYQDAFNEFHYLATTGDGPADLKVKSADLALDCLVALKDHKALQVRSLEYARLYPARRTEYLKISRTATMNIVASNIKSDSSDFKADLAALALVKLDGADDKEKIKFHKNKILVAQKAMDLGAVQSTADTLLKVKGLGSTDREWTLAQKVWASELQLDFAQAYKLSKTMSLPHLSKADRELRLALLADLAGMDSKKHNEAYLKTAPDLRAANLVRVTLIKNSHAPWRELGRFEKQLKLTPDLLAGIALETFARQPDFKRAERLLRSTAIARYPAGLTLARQLELRDFKKFDSQIAVHRLYGYNEKVMARTIRERLRLIGQSERRMQAYIGKRDWTLQILGLHQLVRENRRLYRDILALPVPARLNANQKRQYRDLLTAQSKPYLIKAEKLETELNQMWSAGNSIQNLQSAFMTANNDLQKVYRAEVITLTAIAPPSAQKRLQNLLNTPYKRPSQRDILVARRELRASPFDISKAKTLRELEAQGGRPAMVVYLDERISQLKTGKNL